MIIARVLALIAPLLATFARTYPLIARILK